MLFKRLYGDYMRFIMDEKSFMGFKANEEIKRNCYDDLYEIIYCMYSTISSYK